MEATNFAQVFREELRKLEPKLAVLQDAEAELNKKIDGLDVPLSALCLSGGGIRSAAFALGVLQGLARFGLLGQFHYLSTVSGGGYIGSWLSAWRHHMRRKLEDLPPDVLLYTPRASDEALFRSMDRTQSATGQEAAEIGGLRADSNYLTPKLGLLSADTWAVIALCVRNVVLNWLVFLPLFMGVMYVPHLSNAANQAARGQTQLYGPMMAIGLMAATLALARASWGRRSGKLGNLGFVATVLVPVIVAAMAFTVGAATGGGPPALWAGALAGAGCFLLAWLTASLFCGFGPETFWHVAFDAAAWMVGGAASGCILAAGTSLASGAGLAGPAVLSAGQFTYEQAAAYSPRWLTILGASWAMLSVFGGELAYVGLRSYSARGDMDREWLGRASGWLSAAAVSWAVLAAVSLFGAFALDQLHLAIVGLGGVAGVVALALGSSARTAATEAKNVAGKLPLDTVVSVAGVLFAVFLAICVSWFDSKCLGWIDGVVGITGSWAVHCAWAVVLVGAGVGLSYYVNVNRFSLHALYRNRLVRAFLGSARAAAAPGRLADPFTGFDQADNLRMKDLLAEKPLHLINMTLNVVSTKRLAWQERKAEPFSVTPLAAGNPYVGYRATRDYGDRHDGITLGTAMAISGAAVSPNMGYNSSPIVGFLLMLFNFRLGWWLGNPAQNQYRREGPMFSALPLLEELTGQTKDDTKWVYLSDGGHFENLGLYEMVRRRCRLIVVSDAGCDPKCVFGDLANAARKIYIDLGVSIDFQSLGLSGRQVPPALGAYCAVGRITYPGSGVPGWMLYIKPGYHGNEPVHVQGYANEHPTFPHEATANQFFTESQFEAYRGLGAHITELVCNGGNALPAMKNPSAISLDTLVTVRAKQYLAAVAQQLKPCRP